MNGTTNTQVNQTNEITKVEAAEFVATIATYKPGLYWTLDLAREPKPYRGARINEHGIPTVAEFEAKHEVFAFLKNGTVPADPIVTYEPPLAETPIVSSNLKSANYDPASKDLIITFKAGTRYKYPNFSPELYKEFERTFDGSDGRSAGKFFHANIRSLPNEKIKDEPETKTEQPDQIEPNHEPVMNGHEPDWTDALKQEYHRPTAVAAEQSAAAAVQVADRMVPEFGEVLKKYEPNAIAFGFPPAVDALITKAKLSPEQTGHLLNQFQNLFVLTANMRGKVQTIEIKSVDDTEAIAEAKACHRILRDERLNAERRKRVIKEPYLRPSQLIDGVFRIWMDEITPIEKEALAKAQYAENLEKERMEKLRVERLGKLRLFDADGGMFNLGEIDGNAFELIYQGAIASYNAKKAETARIEQERIDRERAAEAERKRLQEENARLTRERAEEAAKNAELQRIADEQTKSREEMEAENRRQEELRLAEERRLAAIEEAKRLAPDKEKLIAFAAELRAIVFPEVESDKAKGLVDFCLDAIFIAARKLESGAESM